MVKLVIRRAQATADFWLSQALLSCTTWDESLGHPIFQWVILLFSAPPALSFPRPLGLTTPLLPHPSHLSSSRISRLCSTPTRTFFPVASYFSALTVVAPIVPVSTPFSGPFHALFSRSPCSRGQSLVDSSRLQAWGTSSAEAPPAWRTPPIIPPSEGGVRKLLVPVVYLPGLTALPTQSRRV